MVHPISLSAGSFGGATIVPNIFMDHYLPRANGEFVKIYLYLLRQVQRPEAPLSVEAIADIFNMTEKDVLRSLRYWEGEGLLALTAAPDGTLSGIGLREIPEATEAGPAQPADSAVSEAAPTASRRQETDHSGRPGENTLPDEGRDIHARTADAKETAQGSASRTNPDSGSAADAQVPPAKDVPNYSIEELAAFKEDPSGDELISVIQFYLGRPLSSGDLNQIYFFHDCLGFSNDLIEYLFEYCMGAGHTNMRYIEKVAIGWHENHITTRAQARLQSECYQKHCFAVLRAFGLGGRMPSEGEAAYVDQWIREYGFSPDLVLEACKRTMNALHNPSFEYTDKILCRWKEAGAYTMEAVAALDEVHTAQKAQKSVTTHISTRQTRQTGNKFHNFKQRSYDYDELEKTLFHKVHSGAGRNS